jgi:hypothetical protein
MVVALDLKHLGLVLSAGAAVALRFFSDFSFSTIQHQAALANLSLERLSLPVLAVLIQISLNYQLGRDWFNLSPQAPAEILGLMLVLVVGYALLRQLLAPESAAAVVLVAAPFVALAATASACAWVLARASHVA